MLVPQKSNDIEREDMEEEFDYLQEALEEAEQKQKVAEINLFQVWYSAKARDS